MTSTVAGDHLPVVLVVDDDDDNRAALTIALDGSRYRILLASGGAEAIATFERERPDCILLDVRMPEIDGFAVCEQIRSRPYGLETPIIFLTGSRDLETFDRALRVGGGDVLTKPVQPSELLVRVEAALNLRRMSADLREHVECVKQQRDASQRVGLQKERLMAFVVHDLKNPVSSMDLHAQLLLRSADLPPDLRESVTQIRAEAQQLNRMILNLLDMSKADEGKLSPVISRLDLRALATDVERELALLAKSRDVQIELTLDAETIKADVDLLRRALTNLVENALRHAPPKTVVRIIAVSRGDATELRIEDTGPGIPPALQTKIFDPFVQMESSVGISTSRTGRGLGLSFCKLVAEAHGGRIWVEDAQPGSAFCMTLPQTA